MKQLESAIQTAMSFPKAGGALQDVTAEITIAQATILAHAGQYAEAEARLAPLLHSPAPPAAAFDLLARIQAQQGRFQEADGYWQQAQQLDFANPAYVAGLQRIAQFRRQALRWLYWFPWFIMITALIVAGLWLGLLLG